MARMRKELKIYVVRALAVFNTPTEVIDLIKVNYPDDYEQLSLNKNGLKPQNIECYDPTKRAGSDLSPELKTEFEITREQFLAEVKNIPIANVAYRLQRYQRSLEAVNPRAVDHIAKLLRQAAEDVGGVYTNRKEITGAGGQPLNPAPPVSTDEYLAAREQVKDEY